MINLKLINLQISTVHHLFDMSINACTDFFFEWAPRNVAWAPNILF